MRRVTVSRHIEIIASRAMDSAFREKRPISEILDITCPKNIRLQVETQIDVFEQGITKALSGASHLVDEAMRKPESFYSTVPKPRRRGKAK